MSDLARMLREVRVPAPDGSPVAVASPVCIDAATALESAEAEIVRLKGEAVQSAQVIAALDERSAQYEREFKAVERRADEMREATSHLLRYAGSIPPDAPDDLWTKCETHSYQTNGGLRANALIWIDGVTVGDFRRAIRSMKDPAHD